MKVGRIADLEREVKVFVDVLDPNEEGSASTLAGLLCSVYHLMRLTGAGTREDHAAVTSLKCSHPADCRPATRARSSWLSASSSVRRRAEKLRASGTCLLFAIDAPERQDRSGRKKLTVTVGWHSGATMIG